MENVIELICKPYDVASLPQTADFVATVAQGQLSAQVPPGLEIFEPASD